MATITRNFVVGTDIDTAWKRVADVGAVNELFDFLGDVTMDGDTRVCAMDGGELNELIVTVDDIARRVVYSIKESPFQMTHHSAAMQITESDGKTMFNWTTDFKPDAIEPALAEAIDAAVESATRALAG